MTRKTTNFTALALAAAYASATVVIASRGGGHAHLYLLAVQYGCLLPALVCYLWSEKGASDKGRFGLPAAVSYVIYIALLLFVALVLHQGISGGDENGYRFQARIFATGHVAAEAPPQTTDIATYLKEFRFHHHIIYQGKWFGKYPPGWPAILALGMLLKIDWLVNPLCSLMILWVTWRIAYLVFDDATARLALLLLVASPYFVLNSVGFMSHPFCGVLLAGAVLFYFRGVRDGRFADFGWMLLLLGAALLVRPSTALYMGSVLAVATIWTLRQETRKAVGVLAGGLAVGAAAVAALLAYNHALTGSYLRSTYALYSNTTYPLELSLNPKSILHGATVLTRWSLEGTALYAFPFLLVMAGYGLVRESGKRREIYILAALFGSVVLGYMLQTEPSGTHFGERFYFEAFFALAIIGARGWLLLVKRWRISAHASTVLAAAFLCIQAFHYVILIGDAQASWRPSIRMRNAIANPELSGAVIFLGNAPGLSGLDLNWNDADWKHAAVIYVVDPGPTRRAEIACALQRSRWAVLSYDAKTGSPRVDELVPHYSCQVAARKTL
jgi:hypothetical protein